MSNPNRPAASPGLGIQRKFADFLSVVHGVVRKGAKASDERGEVDAARMRLAAARAQKSSARTMIGSADRMARTAWRNREGAEALHRRFQAEAAEAAGFHDDASARLAAANAQVAVASRMIEAADATARAAARNRREAREMKRGSRDRMEEADAFLEEADRGWEVVAGRMRREAARAQRSSADTMIGSASSMARTAHRNKEEAKAMYHRFREEANEAEEFAEEAGKRLAAARAQVAFASRMIDAANEMAAMAVRNRNEAREMHDSSETKAEEAAAFLKEAEKRWEMMDFVEFVMESSFLARKTCGLIGTNGYDCYHGEEDDLTHQQPDAGVSFRSFLFRKSGKEGDGEDDTLEGTLEDTLLSPDPSSAVQSFQGDAPQSPTKDSKGRKGKKKKGENKEEEGAHAFDSFVVERTGATNASSASPSSPGPSAASTSGSSGSSASASSTSASSAGDATHIEAVLVEGAGTSEVNGTYSRCKTDGTDFLPSWFYSSSKYPIVFSRRGIWEGREVTFFVYREAIRGVWNIVCENDPVVCANFYFNERRGHQPPESGWMLCAKWGKGVSPAPTLSFDRFYGEDEEFIA